MPIKQDRPIDTSGFYDPNDGTVAWSSNLQDERIHISPLPNSSAIYVERMYITVIHYTI